MFVLTGAVVTNGTGCCTWDPAICDGADDVCTNPPVVGIGTAGGGAIGIVGACAVIPVCCCGCTFCAELDPAGDVRGAAGDFWAGAEVAALPVFADPVSILGVVAAAA